MATNEEAEEKFLNIIEFNNQQPFTIMHHINPNATTPRKIVDLDEPGKIFSYDSKRFREMVLEYEWIVEKNEESHQKLLSRLRSKKNSMEKAVATEAKKDAKLNYMKNYYYTVDKFRRPEREALDKEKYKKLKREKQKRWRDKKKISQTKDSN